MMEELEFQIVASSACVFRSYTRRLALFVHGDGFTSEAEAIFGRICEGREGQARIDKGSEIGSST